MTASDLRPDLCPAVPPALRSDQSRLLEYAAMPGTQTSAGTGALTGSAEETLAHHHSASEGPPPQSLANAASGASVGTEIALGDSRPQESIRPDLRRLKMHGLGSPILDRAVENSNRPTHQAEVERLRVQLQQLDAEHRLQLFIAEEQGREAGRALARQEDQGRLDQSLERVATLLRSIEEQAGEYLRQVEGDVVSLSLDIAHRVMQHEAQIDRLFLAGAVRVALESMREGGEIRLCVPEVDVEAWNAFMATLVARDKVVQSRQIVVEGDRTMGAGQCICRLATGVLDLGVRAQLGEVERSFDRLLGSRKSRAKGMPATPEPGSSAKAVDSVSGEDIPRAPVSTPLSGAVSVPAAAPLSVSSTGKEKPVG